MLCHNSAEHEGHNFKPFELVFGRLARLPSCEPIESDKIQTYDEYVIERNRKLSRIQEIARKKLIESKIRAKFYYDKKINPKVFRVGDKVWLLKGGKQYKLADQYEGPYTILEIMNDKGNVKIKMKNKKTKVVHVNRSRIPHIGKDN